MANIDTPVPLVIPEKCPGCKDTFNPAHYGDVLDMLLWDDKFNMGEGGFVRIVGWVSCAGHIMGTVIDSFDSEGNSKWEKRPRPWSTEHVYIKDLDGRRLDDVSTCKLDVRVMTRAEYETFSGKFLDRIPELLPCTG